MYMYFEDVDECGGGTGPCQHQCENNVGSFECKCNDGYVTNEDDDTKCDGKPI